MDWMTILDVIMAVSIIGALLCFRISEWHRQESLYWYDVEMYVILDPEQDKRFRPVLEWARKNKPSLWTRLKGWEMPETRKAKAS